jgi:hypothetical protein
MDSTGKPGIWKPEPPDVDDEVVEAAAEDDAVVDATVVCDWLGMKSNPLGLLNEFPNGVIFPVERSRVPTSGLLLSLGSPKKTVPAGIPAVLSAVIVPAAVSTT